MYHPCCSRFCITVISLAWHNERYNKNMASPQEHQCWPASLQKRKSTEATPTISETVAPSTIQDKFKVATLSLYVSKNWLQKISMISLTLKH